MEYKHTNRYLKKYGGEVVAEIQTRLRNRGKYASGKLHDSIKYELKNDGVRITLSFKMAQYGEYVDKGTKPSKYADAKGKGTGKSAFITALQKWCKIKGLPIGLAFPIRRKIWKFGLAPTNFFTIPTKRRQAQLEKNYSKAMALDIEEDLQKEYRALKRK